MTKLRLLAAVSTLAVGVALAGAPAQAFDHVHWGWTNDTVTDLDAYFDVRVDFDPSGLIQTGRLQVMAGNMTAVANGTGATYYSAGENGAGYVPPVIINNIFAPRQDASQNVGTGGGPSLAGLGGGASILSEQGPGDNEVEIKDNFIILDLGSETTNNNYGFNNARQNLTFNFNSGDSEGYVPATDAVDHLAEVAISATAISNIATLDAEHASFVHDGQIAFGGFDTGRGGHGGGWGEISGDDRFGTSGDRNFDMTMLAWTSAQYGLIKKGHTTAIALGDDITNAQASIDATAASNVHTVAVNPITAAGEGGSNRGFGWHQPAIATDNVAIVDLNQFGYSDNFAYASATNHMVGGYKNLGKLDAPALTVSASALGNVSSVTNKFTAR